MEPNPVLPQPIPVRKTFDWSGWLKPLVGPVLVAAALIGYDQFARPHPQPYQSPITATAKTYYTTLPNFYHTTAQAVRSVQLTGQNDTVDALRKHHQPLADAIDSAMKPLIDSKSSTGKFINPIAAADVLDEVAKAMGAKF